MTSAAVRPAANFDLLAAELDLALPEGWQRGLITPRGYPSAYIITGSYGQQCRAEVFYSDADGRRGWVWSVWRQHWTRAGMPYPGMDPYEYGRRGSAVEAVQAAMSALETVQTLLARRLTNG